eukprot:358727-Chlamydomonas_euryale.AAC.5
MTNNRRASKSHRALLQRRCDAVRPEASVAKPVGTPSEHNSQITLCLGIPCHCPAINSKRSTATHDLARPDLTAHCSSRAAVLQGMCVCDAVGCAVEAASSLSYPVAEEKNQFLPGDHQPMLGSKRGNSSKEALSVYSKSRAAFKTNQIV